MNLEHNSLTSFGGLVNLINLKVSMSIACDSLKIPRRVRGKRGGGGVGDITVHALNSDNLEICENL